MVRRCERGIRIAPASAQRPGANGSRSVRTRPPTRCCASSTTGSCPARKSSDAATRPAMPAPTTATRAGRVARGWSPRSRTARCSPTVRGTVETICFEMATYVSRTATTPILNQSNERNATILDARGRLAALSVGIPQFMLTSTLPVRFALEYLGVEEFHEGDVFAANDPYHGGGHLPDYNVFAPVFGDDPVTGERRMVL